MTYNTNEQSMATYMRKDELYIYELSLAHIEYLHACWQARVPKKKIVIIVNYVL